MGCRALLLLSFISLGTATTIQPRLKTLGSPHLSTNPTSDSAVASNYSVLYFQQKVSGGRGLRVLGPKSQPPARTLLGCYSVMEPRHPFQNSDSDT